MKPSSALVGRDRDVAAIAARIDDGERLVTLLGPTGIGKTALAIELARARGGLVVALEGAEDEAQAVDRVLVACGAPAGEAAAALAERGEALIVLDGATKAIAPLVARLVARAPEATFLVTSRERLDLAGEVVHDVGPLDVANGDAVLVLGAAARRAAHGWAPRPEDVPHLVAIARTLEGVPLALELAGARLPLVGAALLAREARSPLEDAAARSFESLDARDKQVLATLSVFRGGFTVETAARVSGQDVASAAAAIDALRARSLVRVRDASAARFDLYAPLRAVVARALPDVVAAARARHAAVFVADAEAAAARAHHDAAARRWLVEERDELMAIALRATSGRPTAREAEPALRAIVALSAVLLARGPIAAVAAIVSPLVERTRDSGADPRLSARATALRGVIRRERGDVRAALTDLLTAESIARAVGDDLLGADVVVELGRTVLAAGEVASARDHFDRAARAYAALGARPAEAHATALLGAASGVLGDVATARALLERACALSARDRFARPPLLVLLARACAEAGDGAAASNALDEAIALASSEDDVRAHGEALVLRGLVRHDEGDLAAASAAFVDARDRFAAHGLDVDAAIARGWLGVVAREEGRGAEAYALLADARDACASAARPAHAAAFGVHLAGLDADVGRLDAAIDALAAQADVAIEPTTAWPPPSRRLASAQRDGQTSRADPLHVRILARCLAARPSARETAPPDDALVIGPAGAWFRPPHAPRVGLERRRTLAAILDRLASAPGESMTSAALFAAAWPGERAIASAAAHRVRVAVATLRKMGLRDLIATTNDGYTLSRSAHIVRAK